MSANKPQKNWVHIKATFGYSERIHVFEDWMKFSFIEENKRQVKIVLNNEHTSDFTFQWMFELIPGKIGAGDSIEKCHLWRISQDICISNQK